jgi:hypothetical protein
VTPVGLNDLDVVVLDSAVRVDVVAEISAGNRLIQLALHLRNVSLIHRPVAVRIASKEAERDVTVLQTITV